MNPYTSFRAAQFGVVSNQAAHALTMPFVVALSVSGKRFVLTSAYTHVLLIACRNMWWIEYKWLVCFDGRTRQLQAAECCKESRTEAKESTERLTYKAAVEIS
eukprot:1363066-Amphidinium_carterae.1